MQAKRKQDLGKESKKTEDKGELIFKGTFSQTNWIKIIIYSRVIVFYFQCLSYVEVYQNKSN